MRQSEHKYRELFECLSDAAFLADEQSGKIIDTNRRAEVLLGRPRAEILGHKQSEFISFNTSTRARALPDTKGLEPLEADLVRADQGEIRVDARATRLALYGRALILWLCHELPNGQSQGM